MLVTYLFPIVRANMDQEIQTTFKSKNFKAPYLALQASARDASGAVGKLTLPAIQWHRNRLKPRPAARDMTL